MARRELPQYNVAEHSWWMMRSTISWGTYTMVEDQSWVFRSVSARNVLKYIYLVGPQGDPAIVFQSYPRPLRNLLIFSDGLLIICGSID